MCLRNNQTRKAWLEANKPDLIIFSLIDSQLNAEKYFGSSGAFRASIIESMKGVSIFTKSEAFILPTPKLPDFSILQYLVNSRVFPLSGDYFRENLLWQKELGLSEFKLIDAQNELCPNSVCRPIIEGGRIWDDTTHITFKGSNLLRNEFWEFIHHG
jgi:hypothetical protein